ncbi:MAG: DUF433 domain-containing protein [Chloroflexota bacterium]|nr:DUF433 domain-containing protein [Chloroflexota bacterium]
MEKILQKRISMDPRIMTGKPVIRGTRIPVKLIIRMLAQGIPDSDIMKEYPKIKHIDIQAALEYAAQVLDNENVYPLPYLAQ